jgi:hypothetical protein
MALDDLTVGQVRTTSKNPKWGIGGLLLKSEQKSHISALNHRKKIGPSRIIDKNLKSIHDNPIKTGHFQREFHGMPAGRHETLAVSGRFSSFLSF